MSDLQPIADRVEIDALHGEFADATRGREYDRLAPLSHGTVSRGYSPTTSSSSAARRSATGSGGSEGSLGTTWCNSRTAGHADRSCCHTFLTDGVISISHDPDYEGLQQVWRPDASDHQ
jgi:hypothetical protein